MGNKLSNKGINHQYIPIKIHSPNQKISNPLQQTLPQPNQPNKQNLQKQNPSPANTIPKQQSTFQQLHGNTLDSSQFHIRNYQQNLQQGTTIVTTMQNQKFLIHYLKFDNHQNYTLYTDTLIYRIKMLRACNKVKDYLSKIVNISAEKVISYSACVKCTMYKVYVIQKYYPMTLQKLFSTTQVSYQDIFTIFKSFTKVMSAYQYKRLRFGTIDFTQISVIPTKHTSQQLEPTNINTHGYICKIGDPYVRKYIQPTQKTKQQTKQTITFEDVYKNDVLYIGKVLTQILSQKMQTQNQATKQKQIISNNNNSQIAAKQQKIKNFLINLLQNYMICRISDRYNWLQIQRHFQQFNNQEKYTQRKSMIQNRNINQQFGQFMQPQSQYKSNSLQKMPATLATSTYHNVEILKNGGNCRDNRANSSYNKQNMSARGNQFITLKPLKRVQSKQNIIQLPSPRNVPQNIPLKPANQQKIAPLQQTIMQTPTFPNINTTMSINASMNKNIPINLSNQIFIQHQRGSGYGVVENSVPQIPVQKINYNNLYHIGKYWGKFQGNFVQGSKEGPGTIYLTNGHIFVGYFSKDLANGKGSIYIDGELVIKGTWKNNILVTQF